MKLQSIFPFLVWLRFTTRESIKADFQAGLTGAVIVLPQGVAFATIAGLPPEYGLYTAMVTPVVAALFGSSFHLVSGPTTAISIVVFSAISHHAQPGSPEFVTLALTLTFLAGVYQLVFGLARMGVLVNFVSHTVVIGFTAGAAILIATSQLKHITGIPVPKGESFLHTWMDLYNGMGDINLYLVMIALLTLFTAILVRKLAPRLPSLLIGMIAGSLLAVFLKQFTDDISLVGEIPAHLPPLSSPEFSLQTFKMLAPEAFAVALLGLIEAVSISRAVATRSSQRIDASQEFIGQGLSNIVGSFFSSYAGSGSFTRSAVNYGAGAKTPLSAIFSALILMVRSGINFIDLAGARGLIEENNRLARQNGGLYFVGLKSSVYEFAAASCFVRDIGNGHFFDSKTSAIASTYRRLDRSVCATCQALIFRECQ